eukprot:TRINITY_DN964_c0_g1_i1.p1 TRINITY_DN964_c0_g1~~TRINITY_DN964_c0_g1_i1.p1  ORF type:complete len:139 (-),score=32.89 TRINITY_DN964_c0_g1_i1:44-460(-)
MVNFMCAVDASEMSQRAVGELLRLAKPTDRIYLLTVSKPVPFDQPSQRAQADQVNAEVAQMLAAHKERCVQAGIVAANVATVIRPGDPINVIPLLVNEFGIDFIVMGSRGLGGVKRALLGSVSDHIVRNATCGVIIVK